MRILFLLTGCWERKPTFPNCHYLCLSSNVHCVYTFHIFCYWSFISDTSGILLSSHLWWRRKYHPQNMLGTVCLKIYQCVWDKRTITSNIVFVCSQDLGRLIVWVLREYKEIEPIILSGEYKAVPILNHNYQKLLRNFVFVQLIL